MANFNEIRRYMLFVCQMVIVVSEILCALLNLSLDRAGTKREIWISLLGTTVGNIMPTPKIKNHYPTEPVEPTVPVCKAK